MSELRVWLLRLSMTRWMVLAKGYCLTTWPTMRANSAPERSGVAVVKCRPVLGSTTPNTFAVPHRSYSLSCLAGFPGLAGIGERTSGSSAHGLQEAYCTPWQRYVAFGSRRELVSPQDAVCRKAPLPSRCCCNGGPFRGWPWGLKGGSRRPEEP